MASKDKAEKPDPVRTMRPQLFSPYMAHPSSNGEGDLQPYGSPQFAWGGLVASKVAGKGAETYSMATEDKAQRLDPVRTMPPSSCCFLAPYVVHPSSNGEGDLSALWFTPVRVGRAVHCHGHHQRQPPHRSCPGCATFQRR